MKLCRGLLIIFCLLLFSQCTIEKRLFRKGYSISWNRHFSHAGLSVEADPVTEIHVDKPADRSVPVEMEIVVDETGDAFFEPEKVVIDSVAVFTVHPQQQLKEPPFSLQDKQLKKNREQAFLQKKTASKFWRACFGILVLLAFLALLVFCGILTWIVFAGWGAAIILRILGVLVVVLVLFLTGVFLLFMLAGGQKSRPVYAQPEVEE